MVIMDPTLIFGIFSSIYFFTSALLFDNSILTFNYVPVLIFTLSSIVVNNKINMDEKQKDMTIFAGHLSFIYLASVIIFRFFFSVKNIIFYFGFFTTIIIVIFGWIFMSSQLPKLLTSQVIQIIRQMNNGDDIVQALNKSYNIYLNVKKFGINFITSISKSFIIDSVRTLRAVNNNLVTNRYSELGLIALNEIRAKSNKIATKYVFQPMMAYAMQSMLNGNLFNQMLTNPNAAASRAPAYRNTLLPNNIEMDLDNIEMDLDEVDDLDDNNGNHDISGASHTNNSAESSPNKESRAELRQRLRQNIAAKRNNRTGITAKNIKNQLSNAKTTNPDFAKTMEELAQGNNLEKILASIPTDQLNGANPAAIKDMLKKLTK